MPKTSGWEQSARYWMTVPARSNALLLAGIFFLFTSFGMVLSFINQTWLHVSWAIALAIVAGAFSVVWAYAGFRRVIWLLVILFPLQFAVNALISDMMHRHIPPP